LALYEWRGEKGRWHWHQLDDSLDLEVKNRKVLGALARLKKVGDLKISVSKIIWEIPVSRNLTLVQSKFLCSGWKSSRLMNWYEMRHFSNYLFLRCLVLTSLKQKISFKHCLTPKNLVTVSFTSPKYMESRETALKEMTLKKYCSSIVKLKCHRSVISPNTALGKWLTSSAKAWHIYGSGINCKCHLWSLICF